MIKSFLKKSMIRFPYFVVIAVLLTASLLFPACAGGSREVYNGFSRESYYFDTVCKITIYGIESENGLLSSSLICSDFFKEAGFASDISSYTDETKDELCGRIISECFKECARYEDLFRKNIEGSDVYNINSALGDAVKVSAETFDLISTSLEFSALSDGLFDITTGTAEELWDFTGGSDENSYVIPSESALREAESHIGWENIALDESTLTVALNDPKTHIDLGGIAKGYISDRLCEFLQDLGVCSAVINLGGNISCVGGMSDSLFVSDTTALNEFSVGIGDPSVETALDSVYTADRLIETLSVSSQCVVTSGTYQRYFILNGVRYHHILDPGTGMPVASDICQASVITDNRHAYAADALATICICLGSEKAASLIDKLNESGIYGELTLITVKED